MDPHFDKDLQYHQTIAREYDEVVVAPRLVTNDALYKKFAHFMSGNRMLDLGCGTGHMSLRFGKYFKEVVAVDHSEAMLERARSKSVAAGFKNVQFICKSVFDYIETAPSDSFDAVCCTGFLHHLKPDEIGAAIRKFARVMTHKAVMLTSIDIEPFLASLRFNLFSVKSEAPMQNRAFEQNLVGAEGGGESPCVSRRNGPG